MTFNEFRNARVVPGLDGLRGVSVLLVLSWHTGDALWQTVRGYLGVTLFFVISGFLITTLLLREQDSYGRVSIWRFYVRRLFRITPMYYFVLLMYAVLVLRFDMAGSSESFGARFLQLATYNGEFAGSGTFSHAWSLGIEEKFYLIWPVLNLRPIIAGSHSGQSDAQGIHFRGRGVGGKAPDPGACLGCTGLCGDRE